MKRRMIVCITLAAILLVVGAAYWAFCRLPHLTGSTIKNADSDLLDAQYMNGTDGHTMMLNAGDQRVLQPRYVHQNQERQIRQDAARRVSE